MQQVARFNRPALGRLGRQGALSGREVRRAGELLLPVEPRRVIGRSGMGPVTEWGHRDPLGC